MPWTRWSRTVCVLLAASLSLFITHLCIGALDPRGPKLVIVPERAEMNIKGRAAEFSFLMRNAGRRPLHIDQVVPDCGCAVIQLPKKTLAPGESQNLLVSAAPPRAATRALHFRIKSNCRMLPVRTVELKVADLTEPPFVLLSPPHVFLRDDGQAEPVTRFVVKTVEKQETEHWLGACVPGTSEAEVSLEDVRDSLYQGGPHRLRHYNFALKLRDDSSTQSWKGNVDLTEGLDRDKVVGRIPLVTEKLPPVFAEPRMAYFAIAPGHTQPISARLRLRARSDELAYVVDHLSANSIDLVAEFDSATKAVVLTFNPTTSVIRTASVMTSVVRVRFHSPEDLQLQIPVVIVRSAHGDPSGTE